MSGRIDETTCGRLLRGAVGLFAAQGYGATSVRQICERAGANVAGVSYHFGSKRALYDAAIDFARSESNARNRWVEMDTERDFWSGAEPEVRLRRFVAMMIDHALDDAGNASDLSRIMIHEMLDPTPAFDRQIEVSIARVFAALREICLALAGEDVDEATITRLAVMINAQCMYPALVAGCLAGLHPEVRFDRDGRDALAGLVSDAMLGAVRAAGAGRD